MAERNRDDDDADDRDDRPARPRRRDDDRPRSVPNKSNTLVILLVVGGVFGLFAIGCGGVMIGLLLPAVQKVREAAARAQEQNNMKQIALAMLNQESANGKWVVPYAVDSQGVTQTGNSFRVSLLPYMDQAALYQAIDLTQPWDSVRNAPQTRLVIPQYQLVDDKPTQSNTTPYRAFVGGGAMFEADGKPVTMVSITDGTSNTIMMVQATEQVPWAKPQELPYSKTSPLPKFGSPRTPNGFNVMMADGSVRFVKSTISEQNLRNAIEKADGNMVNLD